MNGVPNSETIEGVANNTDYPIFYELSGNKKNSVQNRLDARGYNLQTSSADKGPETRTTSEDESTEQTIANDGAGSSGGEITTDGPPPPALEPADDTHDDDTPK